MWPDVQEQVAVEQSQIDQLFTAYKAVIDKCSQAEPNFVELSALAAMLHSFYTGVENLLRRIALGIDGHIPVGVSSHSELLAVMAQPTTRVSPRLLLSPGVAKDAGFGVAK